MPPVFFFVIDVSYAAVSSGMVATACQTIKDSLDSLPGGSRTQVGFITFDRYAQVCMEFCHALKISSFFGG